MKLYINGQDIRRLILSNGEEIKEIQDTAPEHFLKEIAEYLSNKGQEIESLTDLYVVNGPGSATALRAVLAIVNTWKFVRPDIRLYAIKKDPEKDDKLIIDELDQFTETKEMILPVYASGPRITVSKKDQLRRKK